MTTTERCAINFFGLPRAFESLVLPSIIKHIIEPNDNCDYFVHYYHMTEEAAGRSGQGGAINPTSILLLKDAVLRVAASKGETSTPIVGFVHDTEEDFWKKYTPLIERIRTTKLQGKYLYFPWKARTYKHPVTTDNIVKMWHSIQAAFQLMEHTAASHNIHYAIAGMFRSDVVYITSIHLRDHADADDKKSQRVDAAPHYSVTIPNFGNHPISDRAVYGSTPAVKVWATERFARLEDHVHTMQKTDPGWGMHSERFLNATIFPAIRNTGGDDTTHILPHPTLCFLRARADETVWVSDCDGPPSVSAPSILQALHQNIRAAVEETLGRSCSGTIVKLSKNVKSLDCSQKPKTLAK